MGSVVPALVVAAGLCSFAVSLQAEPLSGLGELRRNGEVSHRLFVPKGTAQMMESEHLSAGLAVGLKGPLRQQLGPAAPAVSMNVGTGSRLSVLAAPRHGAMLVLQMPSW